MHCPGFPGGTQHCWPELFLQKNLFWGLLAASRSAKVVVCGREGLELVCGQRLAPISPANPVPCLLLCPFGCHVRASCVWHSPWSIFTIAAPRQQRFGYCRVLVSVFIWAPAASPAFNPLLALPTLFFRQVLRKNNTHLASFWGHRGVWPQMVSGSCFAVTKCPGGTQGLGSALTVPGPCPASLGGLFGTLGSVSVGLAEDTLQSGASGLRGCPPLPSLSPLFPQLRCSWGPLWDMGYPCGMWGTPGFAVHTAPSPTAAAPS